MPPRKFFFSPDTRHGTGAHWHYVIFLKFFFSHDTKEQTNKLSLSLKKERKKTDSAREGWENGTPPPHRDFKERSVMR